MKQKSIDALHRKKSGKVSDKWASYLLHYDEIFAQLRHKPITMLEIGVQNGGSLETWSEFFHAGKLFVGCDINPKCEGLRYKDARIKVVVGDANESSTFETIQQLSSVFDIVIDDGSHFSTDILRSFIRYFPQLKPGGIYVVEDTHCLYLDSHGGGLMNESSANAFFKRLVDVISFQFWKDTTSINNHLRTFFSTKETPTFILEGWVDSIEFKNSIITIKKSHQPGHAKLGPRVLVGSVADVRALK